MALFHANRYCCTLRKASATKQMMPPITNFPSRLSRPVSRRGLTTQYQTNAAITARLIASNTRRAISRQSSMTSGPIRGAGVKSSEVTQRAMT